MLTGMKRPHKVELDLSTATPFFGRFVVEPFERGFGITIGNALRRVLLSSIEGSAITSVKIDGAMHEFAVIPDVVEDTTDIILNLKKVVVDLASDRPKFMTLAGRGPATLTAGDFVTDPDIKVINPELHIVTVAEGGTFKIEAEVDRGRGYLPASLRQLPEEENMGTIHIDAVFTPVRRVNFKVEDTRVGQRTDYDRLIMEITTNGSLSPSEALTAAAEILRDHLDMFIEMDLETRGEGGLVDAELERLRELLLAPVSELELSVRSGNCLKTSNIHTIGELCSKNDAEMLKYRNFGRKSLNEIKEVLAGLGLYLGMDVNGILGDLAPQIYVDHTDEEEGS